MKPYKIYLIIVTVLLIGAIGSGVYVWYLVQKLNATVGAVVVPPKVNDTPDTVIGDTYSTKATTSQDKTEVVPATAVQEPIIVDIDTLSPSQQKILETLGYTGGTFTITPAMITCAENAVGKDRLHEIMGGGTPSALESIKLVPCFKS